MNLDSYSIQELENIDFRSQFGKKIKSEMGISSKEIKKKILEIIEKKKQDQSKNESKDYQEMIKLLPDKFINIRKPHFQIQEKVIEKEVDKEDDLLTESIDLTMNSDEEIDNIDLTKEEDWKTNTILV